jgi:hypothetical protein
MASEKDFDLSEKVCYPKDKFGRPDRNDPDVCSTRFDEDGVQILTSSGFTCWEVLYRKGYWPCMSDFAMICGKSASRMSKCIGYEYFRDSWRMIPAVLSGLSGWFGGHGNTVSTSIAAALGYVANEPKVFVDLIAQMV